MWVKNQPVEYWDATGTLKPAIITAVRDLGTKKVRLTVFEPGGGLTDVDSVVFDARGGASRWRFAE